MSETHPLDYAYPVAPGDVPYWQPGMTLRDYFAAAALPQAVEDYGQPPNGQRKNHGNPVLPYSASMEGMDREAIIARQAYRYADAMMKARASA